MIQQIDGLVDLDVMLPQVLGYQLLKLIRSLWSGSKTRQTNNLLSTNVIDLAIMSGVLPTVDAPKSLKDLEELLKNDIKVKVAGSISYLSIIVIKYLTCIRRCRCRWRSSWEIHG